ncbi:MAG: BadF/BadG/BcrA/BcrD ATPase family protein [Planctomycetota bacterium]|nr:BadF/BadG/BcrA/BcrD ATPase family protein [Planctomycetota bacterium]
MNRPVLIGIDGGGTQTRAIIGHGPEEVIGVGSTRGGCVRDVGERAAGDHVLAAVAAAWSAAGSPVRAADSLFLGMGGVVAPADRAAARRMALRIEHHPDASIEVGHDLCIAHAGALAGTGAGRRGVVLIAGTGASCMGLDARGETSLVGGWGPTLGDAGSGHFLGLEALRAVVRASDGRGPRTALSERVLSSLGIVEPREMLRFVDEHADRRRIAGLAPVVIGLADAGDEVAEAILARGVEELAALVAHAVAAVAANDGGGDVPIAVVGGLTNAGAPFLDPLRSSIRQRSPSARWIEPHGTPLEGALLLASQAQ